MAITPPSQQRSVDPYSNNRYSSVISRFTRVITGGIDCIIFNDSSFRLSWDSYKSVKISSGIVCKDDVLIHIQADYTIDFSDESYYVDDEGGMINEGEYYIVLYYEYSRSMPIPKANYRIIRNMSTYYTTAYRLKYIFIGSADVYYNESATRYEIQSIKYYSTQDPSVIRPIPPGTSLYCDGGVID